MEMCQQQIAKVNTLLYQCMRLERVSSGVDLRFIKRTFGRYLKYLTCSLWWIQYNNLQASRFITCNTMAIARKVATHDMRSDALMSFWRFFKRRRSVSTISDSSRWSNWFWSTRGAGTDPYNGDSIRSTVFIPKRSWPQISQPFIRSRFAAHNLNARRIVVSWADNENGLLNSAAGK